MRRKVTANSRGQPETRSDELDVAAGAEETLLNRALHVHY